MKKLVLLCAVVAMCATSTVVAQDNKEKTKTECTKKCEKKCDKEKKEKDSKSCCTKKTSETKSSGKK